jgi:hypothetical protein
MLIADVERAIEMQYFNDEIKNVFEILIAAANDWPTATETFEEFITQVEKLLVGPSTKQHLQEALSKMTIEKNAWQAESITQLLYVYLYYADDQTLRDVLHDLEKYLKK